MLRLKRAYEAPARNDGHRVLVDRLWPRGLRKDEAEIDAWPKDLAPSDALRKWFGHDPERFAEFRERYRRELEQPEARELLDELARRAARGTVTLVYAAHDEEHNNAVVIAEALRGGARTSRRSSASTSGRDRRAPSRKRSPASAGRGPSGTRSRRSPR